MSALLDQPAVFTERMRRQLARISDYCVWNTSTPGLTYVDQVAKWRELTTLHGLDEPEQAKANVAENCSTPDVPAPHRVRVFVGKDDTDHRRGTHGAWRFPTGRFWFRGKDYDVSEFTLAECEKDTDFRELRPDEFDIMPGEPGYVEPVKPDDELARLRAEVDRLTTALARSEKEAALLREHIQKRKPRRAAKKAVRRG